MKRLISFVLVLLAFLTTSAAAADEKKIGGEVRREGNRVWIDKVPQIAWDRSGTSTFGGTMNAATAVTAYPFEYSDLMGTTALAFRTRFFRGPEGHLWDPSSPVGEFEAEIKLASEASGWELKAVVRLGDPSVKPDMSDQVPEIMKSIDAGIPVLGYDGQMNMNVIYGYDEGGKSFLVDDYSERRPPVKVEAKDIGGLLIYLGNHKDPKDEHQAVLEGLERALRQWKGEPEKRADGNYLFGKAALEEWIKNIEDFKNWNEQQQQFLFFINWWMYCSLVDARSAGEKFLRQHSGEFSGPAAESIIKAADLFQQEHQHSAATFQDQRVFTGPWTDKNFSDWTDEVRAEEIKILKDSLAKETAAFGEIEKALAME